MNDETRPILPPAPGEGQPPSGEQANPTTPLGQPSGQPYGQQPTARRTSSPGQPYADPYTAAYPQQPQPDHLAGPGGTTTATRSRNRGAFAAAVLAGALVIGAGAGLGGAAAWDQFGSNDADSSTSQPNALQAVDHGDAPASDGSVEAVAQQVLPSVVQINVAGRRGQRLRLGHHPERGRRDPHQQPRGRGGRRRRPDPCRSTTARPPTPTIVGTDPLTDTAVIQAKDVSGLTPATIGKSGNLDVGQDVRRDRFAVRPRRRP